VETTIKLFTKKREEFLRLKLHEAINWEKYNLMFISHHSTAIEGSSLTRLESQLLLDEGITPEGKPFEHSQMEKDHFEALNFVVKEAGEKQEITPEFIRAVSSKVMHGTGQVYNVAPGIFDSSKGEYRKTGVMKVEGLVKSLCKNLVKNIHQVETPKDIYDMAFDFHFDLVSIHPFADGNGRVSRLMMNYILLYHDQVPAIIHKEDRKKYINALEESREAESNGPIIAFLYQQQIKEFDRQIEKEQSGNRGQFLNFLA
jgi:Fic family protein